MNRKRKWIALGFLVIVFIGIFLFRLPVILEPGNPLTNKLPVGKPHVYRVRAELGDYLQLAVAQDAADVTVTVFDSANRERFSYDGPSGDQGTELICFLAEESGYFRIEVKALKIRARGTYRISLESPRPPSEQDRERLGAFAFSLEAISAVDRLQALTAFQNAAESWQRAGEQVQQGIALLGMGQKQADVDAKLRAKLEAASIFGKAGKPLLQALVYHGLGMYYHKRVQWQQALPYFKRALPLRKKGVDRGKTLLYMGAAYSGVGLRQHALDFLDEALPLLESYGDDIDRAHYYFQLATVQRFDGKPEQAIAYFLKALELAQGRQRLVQGIRGRLASAYEDLDRLDEALSQRRLALDSLSDQAEPESKGPLQANMAGLLVHMERYGEALAFCEEALINFEEAKNLEMRFHTLFVRAQAHFRSGQFEPALEDMSRAFAFFNGKRSGDRNKQVRAAYGSSRFGYTEFMIQLLMEMPENKEEHQRRALEIADQTRSRALVESLYEARTDLKSLSPQLRMQEEELRKEIKDAVWKMRRPDPSAAKTDPSSESHNALKWMLRGYDKIWTKIRAENGEPNTPPPSLSLTQIQGLLGEKTLLLYYTMASEDVFLWMVDKHTMEGVNLGSRELIEPLARDYFSLVQRRSSRRQAREGELATRLSELLLAKAAYRLKENRLLISSDTALQYLPFGALPQPRAEGGDQQPATPLLAGHEIVYLHSASALAGIRLRNAQRGSAPKALLVMADPVFEKSDTRFAQGPATFQPNGTFKRLEFTAEEAHAVAAKVPGGEHQPILGFEATRQAFFSGGLENYRILHFATHGLLDLTHDELSGLIFSSVDRKGKDLDGFVSSFEIRNMELTADLVVLSACRTAIGKEVRGEGLIGLPQSFLTAGAARTLVSLWAIDDQATATMMGNFYHFLFTEKQAPANALRSACLKMRENPSWEDPYYWAGFVFQGEWKPLAIE